MHAAVRRSVPRRYAGASFAMVTAAAIAVAPITASVGAVTAPASTVLVNPAKLVNLQTQVAGSVAGLLPQAVAPATVAAAAATAPAWGWGDVTFLADTLRDALKATFESAAGTGDYAGGGFPKALQTALEAIKNGSLSGAYSPIGSQIESTLFIGLMSALFPIADRFNPKLGKLGAALDAALNDGSMIALGQAALGLPLRLPTELLKAGEGIVKAIMTGDVTKVGAAVGAGVNNVGKFLEAYVTNSATGLIPNLVKVGSTLLGAVIPSLPASSSAKADAVAARSAVATSAALAASPSAVPSFPDLGELAKTWVDVFKGLGESYFGENGIPRVLKAYMNSIPKGQFVDPFQLAHATLISPLLGVGATLTDTIAKFTPFLGPLGKGLDGTQGPLISMFAAAYGTTINFGTEFFRTMENVVKALGSGDPVAAAKALATGAAATFNAGLDVFFKQDEYLPGLVPALVNVGKGFIDGLSGKTQPEQFGTASTAAAPVTSSKPDVPVSGSGAAATDTERTRGGAPVVTPATAGTPVSTPPATVEVPAKEVSTTPATDAPAKDAPVKETPAADAPAKDAPAKDAPAKDAPVKDAPAKDAPEKDSSASDASAGGAAA